MDPINPIAGNPEALKQATPLPPRSSRTTVIVLSVLILLLSGLSAFFGYQNMQLTKQIAALKVAPSPTPLPETPPTDPSANWKTYTNNTYGFELKSPNELNSPSSEIFNGSVSVNGKKYQTIQLSNGISPAITIIKNWTNLAIDPYSPNISRQTSSMNGITWSAFYDSQGGVPGCDSASFQTLTLDKKDMIFVSYLDETHCPGNPKQMSSVIILNQILSTFKFLDQSPTPTCLPRPACLDATPRCLIPETSDMCPPGPKPISTTYTCPANGYVDCMPIMDAAKQKACSADAMSWYKTNCPDFKGGAL